MLGSSPFTLCKVTGKCFSRKVTKLVSPGRLWEISRSLDLRGEWNLKRQTNFLG